MRKALALTNITLAVALAGVLWSAPAWAGEGPPPGGGCEGNPDGCSGGGPPTPPPLPDYPAPYNTTGTYWVNLNGFQPDEGHINNGRNQVVYDAATRTYGTSASGTTLTTTLSPLATATADTHSQGLGEGIEGAIALGYTVIIHAADLAAADALRSQLGGNATFATVRGNYTTSQSGAGLSTVHAYTSGGPGALAHTFASGCDGGGLACGSGGFSLGLGFQSATDFAGGSALDFIGYISLEADAFAGRTHYTDRFGTRAGTAFAFIDPLVTLDPALGSQYSLTVGGGGVANATPGVPEPATWALMLGGFGLAGSALRRRRMVTVCA
jgi:hypothetical protein